MDFGHFFHVLLEILPIFLFAVITASLIDFYLADNYFSSLSAFSLGRVAERTSSRLRRTNDRSVLEVHEDHEDDENAEIGVPLHAPLPRWVLVLLAAFLGALIPICTCGMIPLAIGLYKKNLDWRIILPFLLAGNACSFTALILNYQVLGLEMTLARFLMAMGFAIVSTYIFNFFAAEKIDAYLEATYNSDKLSHKHCCTVHNEDENLEISISEHCHDEIQASSLKAALLHLSHDLKVALLQFFPWIIFSAFIASLIHFRPQSLNVFGTLIYDQYLAAPLLSAISFPFYLCAGSDIPLSKEFLALGIPVSAILSFMTASPSVNLTTLVVYKQALGLKAAIYITLVSIFVISSLSLFFY